MLRSFTRRVKRKVNGWRFAPDVAVERGANLRRLGTDYGGWYFEDSEDLIGTTIISAGLGEDASFDVEFARTYGAHVIIVDPTPRAIAHFRKLESRFGQASSASYVDGGNQPVEAYPLDGVSRGSLSLVDRALWTENKTLKFFVPPNPDHVSHSVVNFQSNYSQDGPAIDVESVTMPDLVKEFGLQSLSLVKLDIEGAEVAVSRDMITHGIILKQLLIEHDELIIPSRRARDNFMESDQMLRKAGYSGRHFDGSSAFLYVRP